MLSPSIEPPKWLRGGHAETIWAARCAAPAPVAALGPRWQRERWTSPDGDFVDVDSQWGIPGQPHVVMFHGLEGSSESHYARAWAHATCVRGWTLRVVHFRGCSGEINRAPRAYHSGDAAELDWILRACARQAAQDPLCAIGVSLGGNALVKWLGTLALEPSAPSLVAAAAIAAPLDLQAAGMAIEQGMNRWLYTPMFLRTMHEKARAKWAEFPGLFDLERVKHAKTIREFDDAFTAPLHGFKDVWDYWARASAKPQLSSVSIPTWVINAQNDPFVPVASVIGDVRPSGEVRVWQPAAGGHAGFVHQDAQSPWRGGLWYLPLALIDWFDMEVSKHG